MLFCTGGSHTLVSPFSFRLAKRRVLILLVKGNGLERTLIRKKSQSVDIKTIISEEYWEKIIRCKENFLKKGIDPRQEAYLRPEIAESWVRVLQAGKNPQIVFFAQKQEALSEYQKIWNDNQDLITAASPLINNFLELAAVEGYALSLFDKNGFFLIGTHLKIFKNAPAITISWQENTAGTTATWLATIHKRPYLVVGPEHYLDILADVIAYSAPILDDEGQVVGTLALTKKLNKKPWEGGASELNVHAFGWITSLASSIENQLKLQKSNSLLDRAKDDLAKSEQIMKTLMEYSSEALITIDSDGMILCTNPQGKRLLRLDYETQEQRNIMEFFGNQLNLRSISDKKKSNSISEDFIKLDYNKKPYHINVLPISKQDSAEADAIILKIKEVESKIVCKSNQGLDGDFSFNNIIGESKAMQEAIKQARLFAGSYDNILLLGESGTGKELFAQAIHNEQNPNGPLIAVNCAAMPENLIESELFGYEGGAFTGAEKSGRPGKIELANGGTLFLDEIGDMPYKLQAVLLRVLQDKQVMRLGGKNYQKVDFRLIAATNQDLWQLVQEKAFRADLYYRLAVLSLEIPPLRERGHDIAILAEYFLTKNAERRGMKVPTITDKALTKILSYDWPGNVRQLENAMIYALNIAGGGTIDVTHLPKEIFAKGKKAAVKTDQDEQDCSLEEKIGTLLSIKESERLVLLNAMKKAGNNVAIAAKLLDMSKPTLYRKLKEHEIEY
jgi:transcriptional regulator with PAS, ATPase and Fis domain